MKTFERNSRSRERSRKKRLAASLLAALLLHFLMIIFAGWRVQMRTDVGKTEEQFLEITEFIPPEESSPDTVVKDPKKLSDRSYNSEINREKFGISGSPPPSAPFAHDRAEAGESSDDLLSSDDFVRRLAKNSVERPFKDFYSENDGKIGNDGDYKGTETDKTDISVKEFKQYSYWIKLKKKIENAWRPAYGRHLSQNGADIYANIRIVIERDGRLALAQVVTSSGFPQFDREAVRAVRAASPYRPFPQNWQDKKIDTIIRFVIVDLSWRQILIQS